jgi:carbonic anhydrase
MPGSLIPCSTATAPVNIDTTKSSNLPQCTLKCEYKFSYKDSYCSATNMGDYIKLSYDALSSDNVIYNLTKYTVAEIRIYCKSLHTFNSNASDGEIIIVHRSSSGKAPLLVCVPLVKGNSNSVATSKIKTIIESINRLANRLNGVTGTIPNLKYNLNTIIPKKPFYMYTATEPWSPCSTSMCNYIVFTPSSETNIYIPDGYYATLLKVINAHAYTVKSITDTAKNFLSYNSKGPFSSATSDEIYIDCQPVGASDESKTVITNTGASPLDSAVNTASILNNIFIQIIIGSIVFVCFILIISKFLGIAQVKRVATNAFALKGGSWVYTTGAAS